MTGSFLESNSPNFEHVRERRTREKLEVKPDEGRGHELDKVCDFQFHIKGFRPVTDRRSGKHHTSDLWWKSASTQLSVVILSASQLFCCGRTWRWTGTRYWPHRGVFCSWSWWRIRIKICNLKDGGRGDKDRGIWERRGDITIIRASSFAHPLSLQSLHCPARLRTWGPLANRLGGWRVTADKGGSLPLLCYLKSITLAFTFSAPRPPLLVSSDSGLGPAPQQSPHAESPVLLWGGVPPWTRGDKAVL